jgi:hypothetical protein
MSGSMAGEGGRGEAGLKGSFLPEISPQRKSYNKKKDFVGIHEGEDLEDHIDMKSDDSRDHHDDEAMFASAKVDQDFAYLQYYLQQGSKKDWALDQGASSEKIKIFRKLHVKGWSNITLKCLANLDHIPKHIVIKAISDMNIRSKWDHTMGDLEVLEQDKTHGHSFFKFNVRVPHHMQNREAVLVIKIMNGFPEQQQISIV